MLSSSVHLAAASAAAPLHSSRVLRALTPVATAHSGSFGSFRVGARVTASSRHRGSDSAATLSGAAARNYVPDPHLAYTMAAAGGIGGATPSFSEASLRVNRQPLPPPDSPLDKLPYYEPNDLNGSPRVRFSSPQQMLTLPAPLALHFFFPDLDSYTSGGPGGPGVNHNSGGEADGDGGDGGYGGGRSVGSRPSWSSGARRGADAALSGYGGGVGSGGSGAAAVGAAEEGAMLACRLCGGNVDVTRGARGHLLIMERASHTCHHLREVALDTLTLLLVRGYPVDDIMMVWADILYSNPAYPRIHDLSNPRWPIEKRADRLGDVLHGLRQAGLIDVSFAASDPAETNFNLSSIGRCRSVAFQRLEYFGDTCWGANSATRIMLLFPDQQWLYSERTVMFACMRDACEMNVNLDFVFDTLKLSQLMPRASLARLSSGKVKADIVEALLGELHTHLYRMVPKLQDDVEYVETNGAREAQLVSVIQHCITEIYDLIVLNLARALVTTSIPLAKELAAKRVWQQTRPLLLPHKRPFTRSFDAPRPRTGKAAGGSHATTFASATAATTAMAAFPSAVPTVAGVTPAASMMRAPSSSSSSSQVSQTRPYRTTVTSPASAAAATLEDFFDVTPGSVQQHQQQHTGSEVAAASQLAPLSRVVVVAGADGARSVGEAAPQDESTGVDAADPTSTSAVVVMQDGGLDSLAISTAIALGKTRVLPALPRLFPDPRPLPATVPHPLLQLTLHEIPQQTYCEHTDSDIFAGARRSYNRLGLLRETEERPRCVVSSAAPDWAPLIGILVPQLVRLSDTVTDHSLDAQAGVTAASPVEDAQTEAVRRLFVSMDGRGLYWRDPFYNLAPLPAPHSAADGVSSTAKASGSVASPAWVLTNCGLPPLAAAATKESDADGDGGGGVGGGKWGTASIFAASRYVAPGTRTPSAGVVTDRNLSRGTFAFLAVGVPSPVERAERLMSTRENSAEGAGGTDETAGTRTDDATNAPTPAAERGEGTVVYSEERVTAAFDYWRRRRRQVTATSTALPLRTQSASLVARVFAVGAGSQGAG